jgi:hypothetical protein
VEKRLALLAALLRCLLGCSVVHMIVPPFSSGIWTPVFLGPDKILRFSTSKSNTEVGNTAHKPRYGSLKIFSNTFVLAEERLKSTAKAKIASEAVTFIKESPMAIRAKNTGTNVRTVEPLISL